MFSKSIDPALFIAFCVFFISFQTMKKLNIIFGAFDYRQSGEHKSLRSEVQPIVSHSQIVSQVQRTGGTKPRKQQHLSVTRGE